MSCGRAKGRARSGPVRRGACLRAMARGHDKPRRETGRRLTYPAARAAIPEVPEGARVSETVASLLFESIAEVAGDRALCARDPSRDFTRRREIGPEVLLAVLVCWRQRSMSAELHDAFGWNGTAPSSSAFVRQWKKLSDRALPELLRRFNGRFGAVPYLGRFRLLAADGTGIRVPATGDARTRVRSNQGSAEHDELHPTCAYDVMRHTFEDVVFQGAKKSNEPAALCMLVDRMRPAYDGRGARLRDLWVADRNYCSFNVLAHMAEAGAAFVVRANDERATRLLGYEPTGAFDATVTRFLTRSESVSGRSRPRDGHLYRVVDSRQPLDVLPPRSRDEYPLTLRVIRAEIDPADDPNPDGGGHMYLVTNLPADEFPAELVVQTYLLRWSEETAYLHLKHVIGARVQHTRDYDRLCQEVLGRLILFNVCSLGTTGVPIPEPGPKHERATDVKSAFEAMSELLRHGEADVEEAAERHTHPVETGRSNPRRKRAARPTCFTFRC